MDWMKWFVDLLDQQWEHADHADLGDGTRGGFVKVNRSTGLVPRYRPDPTAGGDGVEDRAMTTHGRVVGPSVEPGWLWRQWWIWTEPARLIARLFAEQVFGRRMSIRLLLSALRVLGHVAVGHFWWTALLVGRWMGFGLPFRLMLVVGLVVELGLIVRRVQLGRPSLLAAFRLGVKFHRVWPRVYADTAGKSERIQDREAGMGGESRAPVVRSVVDHPRVPWRFWVNWPVITFRVGVAPGRSFTQLERVMAQMSANIPWIHALELEYQTDRSSFGLLHVAIDDVLARSRRATWSTPTDRLRLVDDDPEGTKAA